jgi:hypothetical protein
MGKKSPPMSPPMGSPQPLGEHSSSQPSTKPTKDSNIGLANADEVLEDPFADPKVSSEPEGNIPIEPPIELTQVERVTPRFRPGQRKPVLYIFSPEEIEVRVNLKLQTPGLRFSTIYPIVPVYKGTHDDESEKIEWIVQTRRDGHLTETKSGSEVAYLYWETQL